jgi:lipopolysaccharide export system permease protein
VLSISAREGRFLAARDSPDTIILRLTDGQIIQDMPGPPARAQFSAATTCRSTCPRSRSSASAAGRSANISCPNCCKIGWSEDQPPNQRGEPGQLQFPHGRSGDDAAAAAAGGGAGDPAQALDLALGVFVSIVMVVAYHKVNSTAGCRRAGRIDPMLALWGPFVLFAALIVWMYYRVAYVPGGQAIGCAGTALPSCRSGWASCSRRASRQRLRAAARGPGEAA